MGKNIYTLYFKEFSYVFINKNTKLSDLKYKEEIFEYYSYNYTHLSQDEINELLKKLMKFKILKSEVVEFKNLLRNTMMVKDKLSKDTIQSLIYLLYNKVGDINEFIKDDIEVDNEFDKDFSPVLNALFVYLSDNLDIFDKEDIALLFKFMIKFDNCSEEAIFSILDLYGAINGVEQYSLDEDSEIMSLLLKLVHDNNKISKDNVTKYIKPFIHDYIVKLKDYLNEFTLKRRVKKIELINMVRLYSQLVDIIKEITKESGLFLILDELGVIKSKLERVIYMNKINPKEALRILDDDKDGYEAVLDNIALNKNI
jgi:hypothetical protein